MHNSSHVRIQFILKINPDSFILIQTFKLYLKSCHYLAGTTWSIMFSVHDDETLLCLSVLFYTI